MTNLFGRNFGLDFNRALGRLSRSILISLSPRVVRSHTSLPNYSWIELAPMMILLLLVVIGLAIIPNCIDNENCVVYPVGQNVDLDKLTEALNESDILFSMTNVEKP